MNNEKIEYLGIEFYRNFIGIEKPLIVLDSESGLEYSVTIDNLTAIIEYKADCKPRLKLPEDLMDDEWLWVLFNGNAQDTACISKEHDGVYLKYRGSDLTKKIYSDGCLMMVLQEMRDRFHSLHSHPKAKEYIDKNLAVRKIR